MDVGYLLQTVLVGFVTGVFSGTFGVGGGVLTTPAIRLFLGGAPLIALGTPLPVTLPTALTGAWNYHRRQEVDWAVARWVGGAGVLAAILGAYLTTRFSGHVLMLLTAFLILIVGLDFASGARQRRLLGGNAIAAADRKLPMILIGLVGGFLSGFLGIGGGVFMVPAFMLGLGMQVKRAFGTSLVVVACLAVPGSVVHLALGHVDPFLALGLTLGVVPGAYLGSSFALRAKGGNLANWFGWFMVAIALFFGGQEIWFWLQKK